MNWNAEVTVDPTVLQLVVGALLPMLVALVAKQNAHAAVKAILLLFLSVLGGWLTELQAQGGSFVLGPTVVSILVVFATAVLSHFGLLKPINLSGSQSVIAKNIPGGIGQEP